MPSEKTILPLQFAGNSFSLLFRVLVKPDFILAGETEYAIVNSSLSELVLKIQDQAFPLATRLLQLGISPIVVIACTQITDFFILDAIIGNIDRDWAIRNLCFLCMINIGLGSLLLIGVNTVAGLYAMIVGSLFSLGVFLLASISPSLHFH